MTDDIRDILSRSATDAGGRLIVRSALNPALWLCAIVSIPGLIIMTFFLNPPWWIGILILFPIFIAGFGFIILLFLDRDKLQSENFQIRKRTLELIEQKGMQGAIPYTAIERLISPDNLNTPSLSKEGEA